VITRQRKRCRLGSDCGFTPLLDHITYHDCCRC
jgi:hypothetical protein